MPLVVAENQNPNLRWILFEEYVIREGIELCPSQPVINKMKVLRLSDYSLNRGFDVIKKPISEGGAALFIVVS